MNDETVPQGRLFSELYIEKGPPLRDSARARERLLATFSQIVDYEKLKPIAQTIHTKN